MKTICFTVALLVLTVPALGGSIEEKNDADFSKRIFIGVAVGPTEIDIDQENYNGNLLLSPPVDTDGLNLSLEAGYRISEQFFTTVSYQYLSTDDADFQHLFASVNIQFSLAPAIRPFIGFVAGFTSMKWERTFNAIYSENETDSGLYGPQVGLEFLGDGPVSVHITYQYLITDLETELYLLPNVSRLTHENFQNLLFGIRYNF